MFTGSPAFMARVQIDGVLVTAAYRPQASCRMVRSASGGRICAASPTRLPARIMLRDSAHIQEFEAEWKKL